MHTQVQPQRILRIQLNSQDIAAGSQITASPPSPAGRSTLSRSATSAGVGDSRHRSVTFDADGARVLLHNLYVPAGGDIPDPQANPKFRHKLDFVEGIRGVSSQTAIPDASVLVGDLNIAPLEHDVWSHNQLLNVVSYTPVETESFEAMRKAGAWADLMRLNVPVDEKLYTWWSYRAADWEISNRGRRLDHIWSSNNLVPAFEGYGSCVPLAAGSGRRIMSR